MFADRNATFDPWAGYSGTGIIVSVAFNPTPTKSTTDDLVIPPQPASAPNTGSAGILPALRCPPHHHVSAPSVYPEPSKGAPTSVPSALNLFRDRFFFPSLLPPFIITSLRHYFVTSAPLTETS